MMTMYARKERTICKTTLAQPAPLAPSQRDVVLYHDAAATVPAGRYPWDYTASKPTRRNRWINHNCARYRLEWLPDA